MAEKRPAKAKADRPRFDKAPGYQLGIGPLPDGRIPKGAPGNPHRAHLAARRAKVEAAELGGGEVRQIAELVKVSPSVVMDDLRAVRRERVERAAGCDLAEERELERARLEQQRRWLATQAQHGSVEANRALIRVAERKAKLLGLDAPQQVAVSGEVRATLASHMTKDELAAMLVEGVDLDDLLDGDGG